MGCELMRVSNCAVRPYQPARPELERQLQFNQVVTVALVGPDLALQLGHFMNHAKPHDLAAGLQASLGNVHRPACLNPFGNGHQLGRGNTGNGVATQCGKYISLKPLDHVISMTGLLGSFQ